MSNPLANFPFLAVSAACVASDGALPLELSNLEQL